MIFFFISFALSHQVFNITSESIKSLVLYFKPRHSVDVSVSSGFQTYFSDITKANRLSLEIQTNDSSTFGPFDHQTHLDGIDFQSDDIEYTLSFVNEGDYEIEFAMVFGENLKSSLNIINHNFSHFYFPITNYPSKKYTFFYHDGLIFHEKKYSLVYFIGISISLIVIFIFVIVIGRPNIFKNLCFQRKSKVN